MCFGLPVYNSKGDFQGKVTSRYQDDVELFVIDDEWEVAVSNTEHVLWTLKPDCRGEHIRLK